MLPRSPASHRFGLGGHGSGPAHRTEVKRQGEIIDARPVAHEVEIGDRDQLPGEDRAEHPSRDPAQQPKSVSHIRRGLRVSQSQSPRTHNNFYRRFRAAGFAHVTMGPRFAIDRPEESQPEWRDYYEGLSVGVLSEAEAAEWRAAASDASAEHSFLWAFGYHCAVGTKV